MHKHRYAYLDGLRGAAAIIVMIFHAQTLWGFNLAHGYLAVDVFFLMSGFVIASAYDARLASEELTALGFLKVRLIRLYPVYLMSFVISLPLFLKTYLGVEGITPGGLLFAAKTMALNLLMLPSYSPRAAVLFAVNLVYWSLFFELVVNMIYAACYRFLKGRILLFIIAASGLALSGLTLMHGNLDYGVSWPEFGTGLLRAVFGIFAGVGLFRYRYKITVPLNRVPAAFVLMFACLPMLLPETGPFDAAIDILAVLAVFPAAILVLSRAISTRATGLWLALGAASYPLYLFHFQVWKYAEIILRYHPEKYAPVAGLVTLGLLILFSIILERRVDEPVRRWMTRRWIKRPISLPSTKAETDIAA